MTATYSSFDTLTVGQIEGSAGTSDGRLPVLAEIPTIGAPHALRHGTVRHEVDQAHAEKPEPHFETEPHTELLHSSPEPKDAPEPMAPEEELDWSESSWSARLLEFEVFVRPHARLIVLVALIALTGLSLALMRAPVAEPQQAPPSDIVDAPRTSPILERHEDTPQLVHAGQATAIVGVSNDLQPIPSLPIMEPKPSATITAVGPASPPMTAWPSKVDDITPFDAPEAIASSGTVATAGGPAAQPADPIRVAERTQYPITDAPSQSWSPHDSLPQPPVARLKSPVHQ